VAYATRLGFRMLGLALTEAAEYPTSDEELRRLDEFVDSHFVELDHASFEALERHRGAVRQYPHSGCVLCGSKRAWNGLWSVAEEVRRFRGARVILVRLCFDCASDPDVEENVKAALVKEKVQVQ
jgi:hypothetical protein